MENESDGNLAEDELRRTLLAEWIRAAEELMLVGTSTMDPAKIVGVFEEQLVALKESFIDAVKTMEDFAAMLEVLDDMFKSKAQGRWPYRRATKPVDMRLNLHVPRVKPYWRRMKCNRS